MWPLINQSNKQTIHQADHSNHSSSRPSPHDTLALSYRTGGWLPVTVQNEWFFVFSVLEIKLPQGWTSAFWPVDSAREFMSSAPEWVCWFSSPIVSSNLFHCNWFRPPSAHTRCLFCWILVSNRGSNCRCGSRQIFMGPTCFLRSTQCI